MSSILPMDDAALDKAAEVLAAGSVAVLPVGGVYAIVADAFRPAATQRIFAARRRSRATPLPVLIRSERQVSGLAGEVPEAADRLMAAYWPGDLTLILQGSEGLSWDLGNSRGTVQLRRPADDWVLRLVGRVGPLACTSANRLDRERPVTAEDAKAQLGVLVPVYVDGGERDGSVSTVVDCTGPSVVVRREGVVPAHHIHLVADGELGWGERPPLPAPAQPQEGAGATAGEPTPRPDATGAADAADAADAAEPAEEAAAAAPSEEAAAAAPTGGASSTDEAAPAPGTADRPAT